MLFLKYLLMIAGSGLLAGAAGILAYDLYLMLGKREQHRRLRWKDARKLTALAAGPLLAGMSIAIVPAGHAAVRVS